MPDSQTKQAYLPLISTAAELDEVSAAVDEKRKAYPRVNSAKKGEPCRRKGIPNKVSRTLIDAIDLAFRALGAEQYLMQVAIEDPKAFCALLGRRLPKDTTIRTDGGLTITVVTGVPSVQKGD